MSELKIIKASAGSGKTFSLTREFLRLLINEPLDYYRTILAVTFTNKATAEMKTRILTELHRLGSGEKSDQLEFLMSVSSSTEAKVREKCNAILIRILHGYSWFRAETIDSFFQGIIRSFLLELGIPGHFTTEVEHDQLLEEAVDQFLNKLGNGGQDFEWLVSYIEDRLRTGKTWGVKKGLMDIGKETFKEIYQENAGSIEEKLGDPDFLKHFRNQLNAIVVGFEMKIESLVLPVFEQMEAAGLSADDFSNKESGPLGFFIKLRRKNYEDPLKRLLDTLNDPEKWSVKTNSRRNEIIRFGQDILEPVARKVLELFDTERPKYLSALILLKNFYFTGLISRISSEIRQVKQEKGIMLLSDAAPFIYRIINDNDTPFIYEKTGNRFNHLLIDEFQDTSEFQYKNFRPLLSNSLSFGHSCLLVGDVKQSIYRWRNGNWQILAKEVGHDFGPAVTLQTLGTNWRSQSRIVNFNNQFFKAAAGVFDSIIQSGNEDYIPAETIYSDVKQEVSPKFSADSGSVFFALFNKNAQKEDENYFGELLIEQINGLFRKGFNPGDIAILVRHKKEGTLLSNFVVDANNQRKFDKATGIISNESLFLCNSPLVKLLLSAMHFVAEPDNRLKSAALIANYLNFHSKEQVELIEIDGEKLQVHSVDQILGEGFTGDCRQIAFENLFSLAGKLAIMLKLNNQEFENVYLHSFLDIIYSFTRNEMSDLNGFLCYWDEVGHKKTISAAETKGSIRILTIHRSKGLEFPAVIIPFAEWDYKPKTFSTLWIKPETAPFNELAAVPVNTEQKLVDSEFANAYHSERYLTLIDNLNLMYVAFTRAVDSLIVFGKADPEKASSVGDLMASTLKILSGQNHLTVCQGDPFIYMQGEPGFYEDKPGEMATGFLEKSETQTALPLIRISNSVRFDDQNEHSARIRYTGNALHAIMENIVVPEDIGKAIHKAVQSGLMRTEDIPEFQQIIERALEAENVREWYSPKFQVLTEAAIIHPDGSMKRPDRLMVSGNAVTVLDYKFGHESESNSHSEQVKGYMNTLQEMGYEIVKGFVWYVTEGKLKEVV